MKSKEQPVLPTFWDVAKAFKWAAEYANERGESLSLYEGQWTIIGGDGDEAETEDLTPRNVAELYCLQKGFEKDEQPVRDVDAIEFLNWAYENRWFKKEGEFWRYTFEQGTSVSAASYKKNYMKTSAQLYNLFKEQKDK